MMTAERYARIARWFRARPGAYRVLRLFNQVLPGLSYVLYPLLLAWLALQRDGRFWRVLIVPLAGFALCTAVRRLVHAPRPYEALDIEPLIVRKKTGDSFPSRHMTCAAVIAAAFGYLWPPAGGVLAVTAIGIALVRVLAGIHFPRDVIAGGLLGAACGAIGFWVIP